MLTVQTQHFPHSLTCHYSPVDLEKNTSIPTEFFLQYHQNFIIQFFKTKIIWKKLYFHDQNFQALAILDEKLKAFIFRFFSFSSSFSKIFLNLVFYLFSNFQYHLPLLTFFINYRGKNCTFFLLSLLTIKSKHVIFWIIY